MCADATITVFDIGGTYIRRARWNRHDGDRVHEYSETASPSLLRYPAIPVPELRQRLVRELCQAVPHEPDPIAALSLGAALDHRSGTVYASAPLWGSCEEPFELRQALTRQRPDVTWHIVNDVTAALLHHASGEASRRRRKDMLVTLSSGIACRTVDHERETIPVDGCGLQGEIGHLPARAFVDDLVVELGCDCGAQNHLASFTSGPGIRRTAEVLRERSPRRWRQSALEGSLDGDRFDERLTAALDDKDPLAQTLVETISRPLAEILVTALCLDPAIDGIGLTGGVAIGLGEPFREALIAQMLDAGPYLTRQRAPDWITERISICDPGGANGLIGAGMAAVAAGTDGVAR